MAVFEDPLAAHRRDDGCAEQLGQRSHAVVGARRNRPTACDHDRAPRRCERARGGHDARGVGRVALARGVHGLEQRPGLAGGPCEHVVGDRQHDRARAAARGDRERDAQAILERIGARDARDPLRDAREHRRLIERLRGVPAGAAVLPVARDVGDDREQRDRRAVGLRDPRDEIRGARADRRVAHADPARDPAVGVGGAGRAAFVAHQHVLDARRLEDAAVERQRLAAGDAEHVPDAGGPQAAGEAHADGFGSRDHRSPAS